MSISDAEGGRSRRAGRAGRVAGMADFHETWGIPMVPKITIEHGFKKYDVNAIYWWPSH